MNSLTEVHAIQYYLSTNEKPQGSYRITEVQSFSNYKLLLLFIFIVFHIQ